MTAYQVTRPTRSQIFVDWMRCDNRRIMQEVQHVVLGNYPPELADMKHVRMLLAGSKRHVPIFLIVARAYGLTTSRAMAEYNALTPLEQCSLDNGVIAAIKQADDGIRNGFY